MALRALGDADALPTGDLGTRRMAAAGGQALTARGLQDRAEAWRPWRAARDVSLVARRKRATLIVTGRTGRRPSWIGPHCVRIEQLAGDHGAGDDEL